MRQRALVIFTMCFLLIGTVFAQRGAGAAGMQGTGQGQGTQQQNRGQMGSPGAGMGKQGSGMGTQSRMRVQATDQQRQRVKSCTQSTERIRQRTRQMSKAAKSGTITAEQAKLWQEELQNEIQLMNQEQEELMASLTEEQKTAAQNTLKEMDKSKIGLLKSVELLDNELIAPELNREKIRDRARETERAANELKKDQIDLAELFGND